MGATIVALSDGVGRPVPGALFVQDHTRTGSGGLGLGGSAADWQAAGWPLLPNGTLMMPVGAFLISSGGRILLIDCGYGDHRPPAVVGPSLAENLAAVSVRPEDVTDVVLTHLHIDHVGGASRDGRPTFPRAVYRCHAADWNHFVTDVADGAPDAAHRRAAGEVLAPIADRFEMWDTAGQIAPGVDVLPIGGHTPGSSIVGVGAGRSRRLLLGDLVHHPVQLVNEHWRRGPDVDPRAARAAAAAVVADLVTSGTPVVGAHFPDLLFGRVVRMTAGLRWRPVANRE